MARKAEIGNVKLYPDRSLTPADKTGFQLQFYCPIQQKRIRRSCGTRNRAEAKRIRQECAARLDNGRYAETGGATVEADERVIDAQRIVTANAELMKWSDAVDRYFIFSRPDMRPKSYNDSVSRLRIVGKVLAAYFDVEVTELTVADCVSVNALEHVRARLLEGAESKQLKADIKKGSLVEHPRSPHTVNSMLATIWPFFEYCVKHKWCGHFERLRKIKTDDPMKGRPITGEEFDRMLAAAPLVVGKGVAESWLFALNVLWESAFRIQDLMEFSWDDERYIHPVWPTKPGQHPTIVIPSAQKNGKWEEIPMLPGLAKLLQQIPVEQRTGWVVAPSPIEFVTKSQTNWFMPAPEKLAGLLPHYSNSAIAKACGVSDRTVGVWLRKLELVRMTPVRKNGAEIPETLVRQLRATAARENAKIIRRSKRLSAEHVGKIISTIGEQAGVVVKAPRKGESGKVKFASAHDLRRGVAKRLINAGVSAETLTVVMRHDDFSTTQEYYGAKKGAQSAAAEINEKLASRPTNSELVGRLVGRFGDLSDLSPRDREELKSLLERV